MVDPCGYFHLVVLLALWGAIFLFYCQYRECLTSQKKQKILIEENDDLGCFAYAAAHDLKAPLRTIMQLSQKLESDLRPVMTQDQADNMHLLKKRAERMDRLIDDLLEYWQAGQKNQPVCAEQADLASILRESIRLLGVEDRFHISWPATCAGIFLSRRPMQQILINLIGNAVKHHHKGRGVIAIDIQQSESIYTISVQDDGPGIAEPYRRKVFEIDYLMPDMNGEVLARAIKGDEALQDTCLIMMTAAGNPITGNAQRTDGFSACLSKPLRGETLAEIMAYVWREYNAGSKNRLIRIDTFNLDQDESRLDKEDVKLEGVRILVAEDSRINQAFVQEVLENMGCRVTVAANGREAINLVRQDQLFDLILLDCQMPVMDGFEVAQRLTKMKASGDLPLDLPVIALTANAMQGDRQKCLKAGMDDYLSKPVRRKDLRDAVYRWTQGRQERHALVDSAVNQEAQQLFKGKYPEMLGYFIEDVRGYLNDIEKGLDGQDAEAVVCAAHTIKSNARNMGAMALSSLAKNMELKARALPASNAKASWDALKQDAARARDLFAQTSDILRAGAIHLHAAGM